MEDRGPPRTLRILYVAVLALVSAGGLYTIVHWAVQGDELAGGAVPVIGRVVKEEPGFGGAPAMVEVVYEAGGRERSARLAVAGGDRDPSVPTFESGDPIALEVARDDPERVQQAGWSAETARAASIPPWLVGGAAAFVIAPLVLPSARRRLQTALSGALRNFGAPRP